MQRQGQVLGVRLGDLDVGDEPGVDEDALGDVVGFRLGRPILVELRRVEPRAIAQELEDDRLGVLAIVGALHRALRRLSGGSRRGNSGLQTPEDGQQIFRPGEFAIGDPGHGDRDLGPAIRGRKGGSGVGAGGPAPDRLPGGPRPIAGGRDRGGGRRGCRGRHRGRGERDVHPRPPGVEDDRGRPHLGHEDRAAQAGLPVDRLALGEGPAVEDGESPIPQDRRARELDLAVELARKVHLISPGLLGAGHDRLGQDAEPRHPPLQRTGPRGDRPLGRPGVRLTRGGRAVGRLGGGRDREEGRRGRLLVVAHQAERIPGRQGPQRGVEGRVGDFQGHRLGDRQGRGRIQVGPGHPAEGRQDQQRGDHRPDRGFHLSP